MAMIGELATSHPIEVESTATVRDAAMRMAEEGIGDVIVVDPANGAVVGMLTDRDITIRLVAPGLDAAGTQVSEVATMDAATIMATEDIETAGALMRERAIRRLPIVDRDGRAVGIVSIEDMATSGYVPDEDLRDLLRTLATGYRMNRTNA